jgi:hypothetical protein
MISANSVPVWFRFFFLLQARPSLSWIPQWGSPIIVILVLTVFSYFNVRPWRFVIWSLATALLRTFFFLLLTKKTFFFNL